jgi:hypothetical protein
MSALRALRPRPPIRSRSPHQNLTHKRQSAHIGGKGRGKTAALVHSAGLTLRGNTGVFSRNDRGGKFNHGLGMSLREEPGYAAGLQYWCRDVRCANRGQHRGCYLGASAVSTITASAYRIAVTVALQTQAGGTTKARRSRALLLLLIAHAHLAVRPERNARKLSERLRQVAVFVAWLIEQMATVERVSRRAERRRNLLAGLI